MRKVFSFEEACQLKGIAPVLPEVSMLPEEFRTPIISHYKLMVITEQINECKEPNWNDRNERKYFPWFLVNASAAQPSGLGLSFNAAGYTYSDTGLGSRLSFRDEEGAEFAGKEHKELYEGLFLKL